MADLVPPHGGLSELVNRNVQAEAEADFRARAASVPTLPVSDADLSTLYRLGDGGLSPLTGAMNRAEYYGVLDNEVIIRGDKPYAWTIPLAFPVDRKLASSLKEGQMVALVNSRDEIVGT